MYYIIFYWFKQIDDEEQKNLSDYSREILFTHHIPRNTGGLRVGPRKILGVLRFLEVPGDPKDWILELDPTFPPCPSYSIF